MRKQLNRLFAFILFLPALSFATANVSGKLSNPSPTDTTIWQNAESHLDLHNCGGNYPVVSGASINSHQVFAISTTDGTWSGTLYRNDEISCNGAFPTWWTLTYWSNGRQIGPSRDLLINSSDCAVSCALDGMTPITVYPTVAAPTGDTTYSRLDGGNTPFTGNVQFNKNLTGSGDNPLVWGGSLTSKRIENVFNVDGFGAKCDGVTDDTTAIQAAITAAGSSVTYFPPGKTCLASGLVGLQYTKLVSSGSVLKAATAGTTIYSTSIQILLAATDRQVIYGLNFDCNNLANSRGVYFGGASAGDVMVDSTVANCTLAGLHLDGTQFGEFRSIKVINNLVGVKLYSIPTAGGGNSNSFYGLQAANNTVGVLVSNTGGLSQGQNYFYNFNPLSNSVAAFASFGTIAGSPTDTYFFGGAPEANGGGASTVTIDGNVVKQAAVYLNNSELYLDKVHIEDATITPWAVIENKSRITLTDMPEGYGNVGGVLVSADTTSTTNLEGTYGAAGHVQNVTSWPSRLLPSQLTGRHFFAGSTIRKVDTSITNTYTGDAQAPPFNDTSGSSSTAFADDAVMGRVNTVTHAASPGTANTNRFNIASAAYAVGQDVMVSLLVKASVQTTYNILIFQINQTATFTLQAGVWTRIVAVWPNQAGSAGGTNIIGFPSDSAGATISVSGLEYLILNPNTPTTANLESLVLNTGSFNPNGISRCFSTTGTTVCKIDNSGNTTVNGTMQWGGGSAITSSTSVVQNGVDINSSNQVTQTHAVYEAGANTNATKIYTNTQALTTGTATHTLANSFTYTSSATFGCTCTDQTAANACKAVPASATTVTLAGTGSDVLWLSCSGH